MSTKLEHECEMAERLMQTAKRTLTDISLRMTLAAFLSGFALLLAGCNSPSSNASADGSASAASEKAGWFFPNNTFKTPQGQALARAAQDNNANEVRRLIKDEHINPDTVFGQGNYYAEGVPLLAWPIVTQSLVGLKALLDNGANPNVKLRYPAADKTDVRYYDNPMVYASKEEDPAYLKLLLEHGGDPNTRNGDDETLLFQAFIWHNQWQNVMLLVEHGADVNAMSSGASILSDYTKFGDFDKAFWLLQHGADPQANSGIRPPGEAVHYLPIEAIFWYPANPRVIDGKRKCQQWLLAHGFKRPPLPEVYRKWRKDLGQPYEEKDIPLL